MLMAIAAKRDPLAIVTSAFERSRSAKRPGAYVYAVIRGEAKA